jgi:internalin A
MTAKSEEVRIARKRIAEEAKNKTGSLDLANLKLKELPSDLAGLHHLRRLNIGVERYGDLPDFSGEASMQLTPLTALTELRELYCDGIAVSDLEPLRALSKLQTLDCSYSKVTRLDALSNLKQLRWLECAGTGVSDLRPLLSLEHLENLDLSGCNLEDPFAELWETPALRYVNLLGATIPGVPDEILTDSDNHLQLIRAHLRDLAEGSAARTDVKMIFLGNGRVGKTQLTRRLRGEPFQPQWDSTHGVLVKPAMLISVEQASRQG